MSCDGREYMKKHEHVWEWFGLVKSGKYEGKHMYLCISAPRCTVTKYEDEKI